MHSVNEPREWKCWGWCMNGGFQTVTVKAITLAEAIQKASREYHMSVSHVE